MDYFGRLCGEEGIPVQGYCSGAAPTSAAASALGNGKFGNGGSGLPELSVCTIEKAASLINSMLADGTEEDLGCVVVDEAHMIGDGDRGYVLEIMLAKLLYVAAERVQIVCLSATVPNISDLAAWLNADLYVTAFRPIPLTEFVVSGGQVRDSLGAPVRSLAGPGKAPGTAANPGGASKQADPDGIIAICRQAMEAGKSVLIFCATKKATQSCAQLLASALARSPSGAASTGPRDVPGDNGGGGGGRREAGAAHSGAAMDDSPSSVSEGSIEWKRREIVKQLRGAPCGMDASLASVIAAGVAFHHAGLTLEERMIVEGAFHCGTLRILTATSTLVSLSLSLSLSVICSRSLVLSVAHPLFLSRSLSPSLSRPSFSRSLSSALSLAYPQLSVTHTVTLPHTLAHASAPTHPSADA